MSGYQNAQEIGAIETMEKVGIPTVVVDFRDHPLETTGSSVEILGQIMGREDRAREFVEFYDTQIELVRSRVAGLEPRPVTFLYRAAGLLECCGTLGRSNLGELIELAGGQNLGTQFLAGESGTLAEEQVFASDPDLIVLTGSNWTNSPNKAPGVGYVSMGYQADPEQSRAQLRAITEQPGWSSLGAVRTGQVHARVAPVLRLAVQLPRSHPAREVAAPAGARRRRPDADLPGVPRALPARPVQRHVLGDVVTAVAATPAAGVAAYRRLSLRRTAILGALLAALLGSVFADVVLGPSNLSVLGALRAIIAPSTATAIEHTIVWDIRLPMALMAVAVGASLAVAGRADADDPQQPAGRAVHARHLGRGELRGRAASIVLGVSVLFRSAGSSSSPRTRSSARCWPALLI